MGNHIDAQTSDTSNCCFQSHPDGKVHTLKRLSKEDLEKYGFNTNDAGETTSNTIDETLAERGNRYGAFSEHAHTSQSLLGVILDNGTGWEQMEDYQKEATTMICHKLARIANGDPHYDDSWRDIAGYAQLVVDILNGKDT